MSSKLDQISKKLLLQCDREDAVEMVAGVLFRGHSRKCVDTGLVITLLRSLFSVCRTDRTVVLEDQRNDKVSRRLG